MTGPPECRQNYNTPGLTSQPAESSLTYNHGSCTRVNYGGSSFAPANSQQSPHTSLTDTANLEESLYSRLASCDGAAGLDAQSACLETRDGCAGLSGQNAAYTWNVALGTEVLDTIALSGARTSMLRASRRSSPTATVTNVLRSTIPAEQSLASKGSRTTAEASHTRESANGDLGRSQTETPGKDGSHQGMQRARRRMCMTQVGACWH